MKKSQVEEQILRAAEELFMEKGFDAVSTTDIARKVGCNQALVHYYFRTKDNLFLQVFLQKFSIIMSKISSEITPNEHDFFVILDRFIDTYFEMLSENRTLPFFLVNELLLRPERREIVREHIANNCEYLEYYYSIDRMVKTEIGKGTIRPIETMDLTLDLISLIVFTFISLPMYSDFFHQDEEQINTYLLRRKKEVKELVMRGIVINKQ